MATVSHLPRVANMDEVRRLLDQFAPRPGNAGLAQRSPSGYDSVTGLDLSRVQNPQDVIYIQRLIAMLRSFDQGNPDLNCGFNVIDGQYHIWLVYFSGHYTMWHFRMLAGVSHPVTNWNPLKEENIEVFDAREFRTCIRVRIDPLPSAILTLPLSQTPSEVRAQHLLASEPAPTFAIAEPPPPPPPPASTTTVVLARRDASPERASDKAKKTKKQTARKKRELRSRRNAPGLLTLLTRAAIGPRNSSSSSASDSESDS